MENDTQSLTTVLFGDNPPRWWPYRYLVFPYLVSGSLLLAGYMVGQMSEKSWTTIASVVLAVTWLLLELPHRWHHIDVEQDNVPAKPPKPRGTWKWWTYGDLDVPLHERVTAPIIGGAALIAVSVAYGRMIIAEGGFSEVPIPMWLLFAFCLWFFLHIITPRHAPKIIKWLAKIGLFIMDFFRHLRKLLEVLAEDETIDRGDRTD